MVTGRVGWERSRVILKLNKPCLWVHCVQHGKVEKRGYLSFDEDCTLLIVLG